MNHSSVHQDESGDEQQVPSLATDDQDTSSSYMSTPSAWTYGSYGSQQQQQQQHQVQWSQYLTQSQPNQGSYGTYGGYSYTTGADPYTSGGAYQNSPTSTSQAAWPQADFSAHGSPTVATTSYSNNSSKRSKGGSSSKGAGGDVKHSSSKHSSSKHRSSKDSKGDGGSTSHKAKGKGRDTQGHAAADRASSVSTPQSLADSTATSTTTAGGSSSHISDYSYDYRSPSIGSPQTMPDLGGVSYSGWTSSSTPTGSMVMAAAQLHQQQQQHPSTYMVAGMVGGGSKRGPGNNSDNPEPDMRERNRLAAMRTRRKKSATIDQLERDEEGVIRQNRELEASAQDLRNQVQGLRTLLRQHTSCDCILIRRYLHYTGDHALAQGGGGDEDAEGEEVEHVEGCRHHPGWSGGAGGASAGGA
ncbi:hypothetical protein B0T17DRAFT_508059 [Bombardia bombarda]|uniref:BZIP domain-containing protein n=1 Tax=Bombardia bombarda TaxID=252184 RepID=A0AA40C4T0_9PEZI|nr:hypothetical protein B0T17DRAFT_508059 [Bombardia bombarda]